MCMEEFGIQATSITKIQLQEAFKCRSAHKLLKELH